MEISPKTTSSIYSVKWVGLFVILLAGLATIKELWDLLGDLDLSMVSFKQSLVLLGSTMRAMSCVVASKVGMHIPRGH